MRDEPRPGASKLLVVMTADKGLCGSFNTNIIKEAARYIVDSPGRQFALGLVGRKGRDFFRRRGFDVRYEAVNVFSRVSYEDAQELAQAVIHEPAVLLLDEPSSNLDTAGHDAVARRLLIDDDVAGQQQADLQLGMERPIRERRVARTENDVSAEVPVHTRTRR